MSLFIVETLHFNKCQRVVHEGVSSREAISRILLSNKDHGNNSVSVVEKINFNGNVTDVTCEVKVEYSVTSRETKESYRQCY